jgi:hypothetical protein
VTARRPNRDPAATVFDNCLRPATNDGESLNILDVFNFADDGALGELNAIDGDAQRGCLNDGTITESEIECEAFTFFEETELHVAVRTFDDTVAGSANSATEQDENTHYESWPTSSNPAHDLFSDDIDLCTLAVLLDPGFSRWSFFSNRPKPGPQRLHAAH